MLPRKDESDCKLLLRRHRREELAPEKLDPDAAPGEFYYNDKGASTDGEAWMADRMRTAYAPEPPASYIGNCVIERLGARRQHASTVNDASLRGAFDWSRLSLGASEDRGILTIPFDLPDGPVEGVTQSGHVA